MTEFNHSSENSDSHTSAVAVSESGSGGISRQQLLSASGNASDSLVGKELAERYLVTDQLGSGAMGIVYKARHKVLDREVAIKVLKRDAADDEVSRRRFEKEAKAASSLTHPNLIAVHDYGFTPENNPFFVMDYLEGESLASLLKRERQLDALRLIRILKQVCAGLAHAHSKGFVHRDLKPNNLILIKHVDGDEFVKIVDFGIAKPLAGNDQELTQTGQIFGTPLYMSPEQCQGQKLDGRSDIYSLGCLTYRIIAGKLPFVGDNPVTTIVMHVKEPAPAIPEDRCSTDMMRQLAAVTMKMLEKKPADRYQSAEELRAELERVERGEPAQAPAVDLAPAASGPSQQLTLNIDEADVHSSGTSANSSSQSQSTRTATLRRPSPFVTSKLLVATTLGCVFAAIAIAGFVGATIFSHPNTPQASSAANQTAGQDSGKAADGSANLGVAAAKQQSEHGSKSGSPKTAKNVTPHPSPPGYWKEPEMSPVAPDRLAKAPAPETSADTQQPQEQPATRPVRHVQHRSGRRESKLIKIIRKLF